MKNKLFRDPVHGYISIREDICKDFIDTPVFQRLKHIEQTSIRCLYPAARHDRFIHSIGTYFLAERVWKYIEPQICKHIPNVESMKLTFLLASLLHDCAHSPFSHTGEDVAKKYLLCDAKKDLITILASGSFSNDLSQAKPAMHEISSAFVAIKVFGKLLNEKYFVRNEDLSRMITGVKYLPENQEITHVEKVKNCLIDLLNGKVLDVDKCDYLARDTWASGVDNTSVDFERLFSGIHLNLRDPVGTISLKHQAISSIVNASYARDFLFLWIISHHKVQYWQLILTKNIDDLMRILAKKSHKSINYVAKKIFSYKNLLTETTLAGEVFYMPTDGDLFYLMKKYCRGRSLWNDFAYRDSLYIPAWKTYAEFCAIFQSDVINELKLLRESFSDKSHTYTDNEIWIKLSRVFKNAVQRQYEYKKSCDFFTIEVNPKVTIKNLEDFPFLVSPPEERYLRFASIGLFPNESPAPFFYLYFKGDNGKREAIIKELKSILKKSIENLLPGIKTSLETTE